MMLNAKEPHTVYYILRRIVGSQNPCLVSHKCIKFILHSNILVGFTLSLFVGRRRFWTWKVSKKDRELFGLMDIIFGMCNHGVTRCCDGRRG